MTKVEYGKRLFLSHKSIASLPYEYLTVIGTLRASSIGLFSSMEKVKKVNLRFGLALYGSNGFANVAFFRLIINIK